jgi:hypothetical protein
VSVARFTPWLQLLVLAVAGFCAVGCPGKLDNPGDFSNPLGDGGGSGGSGGSSGVRCNIDPSQVPAQIFQPSCATSACHDASNPAGELDMVSPDLTSRLIDVPSSQCPQYNRIDRAAPESSLLIDKLVKAVPVCGDRMPFGGTLPPDQIQCVRDWINLVLGGSGDASTDATTD